MDCYITAQWIIIKEKTKIRSATYYIAKINPTITPYTKGGNQNAVT